TVSGTPTVFVDTRKGPVMVYFTALGFRGRTAQGPLWQGVGGGAIDPSQFLVSVTPGVKERANNNVAVDATGFSGGTLIANSSTVQFSGTQLTGAVFARIISLRNGAAIDPAPFDWSFFVPEDTSGYPKVAVQDSPIRLYATDSISDPDIV